MSPRRKKKKEPKSFRINFLGRWHRYKVDQGVVLRWMVEACERACGKTPPEGRPIRVDELPAFARALVDSCHTLTLTDPYPSLLHDVIRVRTSANRHFSNLADANGDPDLLAWVKSSGKVLKVLNRVLAILIGEPTDTQKFPQKYDHEKMSTAELKDMFKHVNFDAKPECLAKCVGCNESSSPTKQSQPQPQIGHAECVGGGESSSPTKRKKGKKGKKGKKTSPRTSPAGSPPQSQAKSVPQPVHQAAGPSSGLPPHPYAQHFTEDTKFQGGRTKDWDKDYAHLREWTRESVLEEDADLDYYLLCHCYLSDFHEVRQHVAELWCDYFYDDSRNINTLAVVHNAACEVFVYMERDFMEELSRLRLDPAIKKRPTTFDGYRDLLGMLLKDRGTDHASCPSGGDDDEWVFDEEFWHNELDWMAFGGYTAFKDLQTMYFPQTETISSTFSTKRRSPKYGAVFNEDLRQFYRFITHYMYGEASQLSAIKRDFHEPSILPGEPNHQLFFQQRLDSAELPCAAIWTTQLYLDMRNILEYKVAEPFDILHEHASKVEIQMVNLMNDLQPVDRRSGTTILLANIRRYILDDCLWDEKKQKLQKLGLPYADLERFSALKSDAVWSGILDFQVRLWSIELALVWLEYEPGFLRVLSMYTQLAGEETFPKWPQMEHFVRLHSVRALLHSLMGKDPSLRSVIQGTRATSHCVFWKMLDSTIECISKFLRRYGADAATGARRNRFRMDYAEDLRLLLQQTRANNDAWRQSQDIRNVRKIEKGQLPAMRPTEALDVVHMYADDLCMHNFKFDYFHFLDNVKVICMLLPRELRDRGVIEFRGNCPDWDWFELMERPDAEDIVKEAFRAALEKWEVEKKTDEPKDVVDEDGELSDMYGVTDDEDEEIEYGETENEDGEMDSYGDTADEDEDGEPTNGYGDTSDEDGN